MELQELTDIYVGRGLEPDLARQVALQLTAKDALAAHARDELGISDFARARPVQAAIASAASFAAGAALPLLVVIASPLSMASPLVAAFALVFLAALGALAARVGGAMVTRPVIRVVFWGAFAMIASAAIGAALGVVV